MGGLSIRLLAVVTALGALSACEVSGLIGSNRSMEAGGAADDAGTDDGPTDTGAGADVRGEGTDQGGTEDDGGPADDAAADGDSDGGVTFDVGIPGWGATCEAPRGVACDADDADPWHAVGINCGGFEAEVTHVGDPLSMAVQTGTLGSSGAYEPREGERMLILSTGRAADIRLKPADLLDASPHCADADVSCPSRNLGGPDQVPLSELPAPLDHRRVDDHRSCTDDPSLVGSGDCSNTLQDEFRPDAGAWDYAAIEVSAVVPDEANALAFQFAFFTAEFPRSAAVPTPWAWNDMYVAWLESEEWTGNVSFDKEGDPVSVNSVSLDYRDAPAHDCSDCDAPELAGFAAEGHAGTSWLRTTAPVTPGEKITLVIAVMDIMDAYTDSAILLDGFEWTCSGLPPLTTPVG